jgi:hypothetical protein
MGDPLKPPTEEPIPAWEVVLYDGDHDLLQRCPVVGGWLYRSTISRYGSSNEPLLMAMTFVADVSVAQEAPPRVT